MIRRLENWSMGAKDHYETGDICLSGEIYGDPKRPDGRCITTSRIVGADGRNVRTASGSSYRLGEPSDGYRAWLRDNRPDWDPDNPVTVVGDDTKKKFATTHI